MPIKDRTTLKDSADWIQISGYEYLLLGTAEEGDPRGSSEDEREVVSGLSPRETFLRNKSIPAAITLERRGEEREIVVVLSGDVLAESELGRWSLKRGNWVAVPPGGVSFQNVNAVPQGGSKGSCELLHITGTWDELIRLSIFHFSASRPCDRHYHDGNEYWFVFRGRFELLEGAERHLVKPGDMFAVRAGVEHGMGAVEEVVEGVGFGTQLEGLRRNGHLWSEVHGVPRIPISEVVLEPTAAANA